MDPERPHRTSRRPATLRRGRFAALLGLAVALGGLIGVAHGCLRREPAGTGAGTRPLPPLPPKEVTIAAAGDVMLDRGVWNRIKEYGIHYIMAQVRDPLRAADLTFVNLECPLSTVQGHALPGGDMTFCAHPRTVQALLDAGVNVVSIANNHTLDAGREGADDTIRTLEANHIAYVGGGPKGSPPDAITTLQVDDTKVAFLAYTDLSFDCGSTCKVDPDMRNALAKVRQARNNADVVVVSYHWGEEYEATPTSRQRALGHATIDAGADVILGQHPHVLSGVEFYHRGLIVYSMGNFVFDQRDAPDGRMTSAIFGLRIVPGQRIDLTITPLRIPSPEYAPRPAGEDRSREILTRLARMSQELGTSLRIDGQKARAGFVLGTASASPDAPGGTSEPTVKGSSR